MNLRPICKAQRHFVLSKDAQNETYIARIDKELIGMDDYSLMWDTIRDIKSKVIDKNDCSQNISLANLFRRILESYVNFIGLGKDAWAAVYDTDKENPDYVLKCAFLSMINDESHKVSPFDSVYFEKIHKETPAKLFDVFESIFDGIGAKVHYRMMMGKTK